METGPVVLTYNLDEEYQIRIEKPEEFNQSYFRDVYSQAAKAVTGIINQNIDSNGKTYPFAKETKEFNNIIAFVGGRGTGKTSCMVSFAKYLISDSKKDFKFEQEKIDAKENKKISILNTKFVSLPTIDPSLFEKEENIIEVVLAQMFSDFESILEKNQREIDQDIRRKLIERFDVVYRNLQTIIKGRKNYDAESLETLSKLAKSTNLRDNFKKLVHEFTKLKAKPDNERISNEDAFLVIPIDDFDLNVKAAAEMSEQIRKYFMIPNVIILMSVNMDQLKDAKELSIRQDFRGMEQYMEEDPAQMAVEYLLKLIPGNRRYYMPEIKYHLDNTLIRRNKTSPETSVPPNKDVIITEYILSQIFKKTDLIFLTNEDEKHIIIPNTQRKLKEFIFFLERKLTSEDKEYNLKLFEDYIINTYIPSLIPKAFQKYFSEIKNAEIINLNWSTINVFINIVKNEALHYNSNLYSLNNPINTFPNLRSDLKEYTEELSELLSRDNNPFNISIGDTLFIINLINRYINKPEFSLFSNSVKLYYSIAILKSTKTTNNIIIKTLIGDSLLPCESLIRVVPLKKYSPIPHLGGKPTSRITHNYINREKTNIYYKLFAVYNGDNYLRRRRTSRNFYEGITYAANNNYKLDLLSCFVNTNYMLNEEISKTIPEVQKKGSKHSKSITNFSLLPLYSIDLIENTLYKSFRFDINDSLSIELINIFIEIKERLTKTTNNNKWIDKEINKYTKNIDIFISYIEKKELSSFINELGQHNLKTITDKYYKNIYNEITNFKSRLLNCSPNKKVITFIREERSIISKFKEPWNDNSSIKELLSILTDVEENEKEIKFKDFLDLNKNNIEQLFINIEKDILN